MQAVKEKLTDMVTMRKVKAETKAEEEAEKEMAKTRMEVAHELKLAKDAEAEMQLHYGRANQKVEKEIAKHEMAQEVVVADVHNANINMPSGPLPNVAGTN